ncbi:DUF3467 domain-containing protein [Sphingobacterium sp. N143]|uniref:DUF3467 domain-containing protein n=1 Tax=Sphingobacterium sp. N143 TaxID=2746727 RepID=UPI002578A444|nr:DUF3467 domain-containing protein [Sphingobacterium sp. N143]MDM1293107.1 DUF3467 domain-containing protein [Sphingobacterium sp. N143]
MENNQNQNELSIELTEEVAEGTYSNLAIITHSNTEFVVDFIRVMPGVPKAKVKSRIVLTPEHAKRLLGALVDNVNRFEALNGPIKMDAGVAEQQPQQGGDPTVAFPFGTPQGQA